MAGARKKSEPQVTVVEAIDGELAAIRRRDASVADSTQAAALRVLAKALDDPGNSATSKSMCARALFEGLDRLRELVPPEERKDAIDELNARRTARRAAS